MTVTFIIAYTTIPRSLSVIRIRNTGAVLKISNMQPSNKDKWSES
jgi:hypothetical protein